MGWKTSADHAVAELSRPDREEADRYFSRAREGEAACERETGIKNHTVVLEVVPRTTPHTVVLKASADHAVAEFQRQKTVLRVSATRCCKLPDRGAREHLPRTIDHAVAQYYVVVLEVPEESAEW